ncbi:PRD domain-containing protein [Enterococcus columbae]|uniref:PRD domain-containing protein n=1 Tax=Enterococcus columbae DSM 7374 = ATCC 51263 TaxID=1121865 RepID=S0KMW0_9ENTE|nr:PRD domain-containing protein [Enterococcus columbae]EOT40536.1 hypothetical protein OMW_01398 [Enterococcus columbae DSM 7374 = ATCC 51263]EOW80312.1 hypothetical protein I568_02012 [Enterococcus columbae DSM 7374 = ATCC 51263]
MRYRVIKPLNNNVAIVRTNQEEQAIVMGAGIAFQKKKGDLISSEKVDKIFILKNQEAQLNFSTLLKEIPLDFITTTYEIIENGIKRYQYQVQEYLYVTLTDHIYWSYQHLKNDEYVESKLPSMQAQYPVEYEIAKEAIQIIQKRLWMKFPKDEQTRIALHFINAKKQGDSPTEIHQEKKNELILKIKDFLEDHQVIRTKKNQNFYDRLMIHLSYFIDRIEEDCQQSDDFIEQLDQSLKQDYPTAYQLSNQLFALIQHQYNKELSNNEMIYLTIHIQRLL